MYVALNETVESQLAGTNGSHLLGRQVGQNQEGGDVYAKLIAASGPTGMGSQPPAPASSGTQGEEHDGRRTEHATHHLKAGHPLPQELPGEDDRDSRAERYEGRHHCG